MSNVNPLTYFKRIKKNLDKHVKIWPWAQSQRYLYENRKAIGCNKITVYILILSFQSASLVSRSPAIKCKIWCKFFWSSFSILWKFFFPRLLCHDSWKMSKWKGECTFRKFYPIVTRIHTWLHNKWECYRKSIPLWYSVGV